MRTWTFWDLARREFTGRRYSSSDDAELPANTPPGCVAVEGVFDRDAHRLDEATGRVERWRDPRPTDEHEWDGERGAWQVSAAAQRRATVEEMRSLEADQARAVREALLELLPPAKGARLREVESKIMALRTRLPPPVE